MSEADILSEAGVDPSEQEVSGIKGRWTLPFEREEYQERLKKTKARMEAAGIEVLVATDPANMNYLTGYDAWSFYTPQAVVVDLEAPEPFWFGRGMDANGAKVTTYLAHANILGFPDHYVHAPDRHPMNFLARVLEDMGLSRKVVGLEMDSYYFSPIGYEALRQDLPSARFKDANLLVNWVRAVKSPAELRLIEQAARILERVMEVALAAVRPGVRQCDAVSDIAKAQIEGTAEFGGDYPAIVPMLPSGLGTSTPHLTWSDAPFITGEATILELAGCRMRYHCPMARTAFLGRPPQRLVDAAEIVVEGLNAALDAARPGATCEEVEAAWARTIAKSGLIKESRVGYSTGLNYPPDWGEHTMSLRPGDRSVLEPNMVFHLIPGIWQDDWGIEISETFKVTEQGAVALAHVPRQLFVKE